MRQTLNILRGRLCLLLSLGLFAACSSDDDEQAPSKKAYPLTIEVTENPLVTEGVKGVATKGTITTASTLNEFYMGYVFANTPSTEKEKAMKTAEGKWNGGTWPGAAAENNYVVNWYAYSDNNATFSATNGNNPNINFTVDADALAQHDLLVAKAADTWSNCGGHLFFTFDHACSALCLYIKKATNLNDYTLSVSNVILHNVVNQGQYYFETGTWTLADSRGSYDIYPGSTAQTLGSTDYIPMDGVTSGEDHQYLFMIPQTLTAWDGNTAIASATTSYLEIECTITAANSEPVYSGTAYVPFGATFVKGTQHNVKINIGKNSLYKYDTSTNTYTKIIP